jgi:hypothetical protein
MEQEKSLADLLVDPVEGTRVAMMVDWVLSLESQSRAAALMVGGLIAKQETVEAARDLYSLQGVLDNLSSHLKKIHGSLYAKANPSPQPVVETAEEAQIVLH